MVPNLTTQVAREQQLRMLAEASIKQRHARLTPATSGAATGIIRSLAAARAWTRAAALAGAPRRTA